MITLPIRIVVATTILFILVDNHYSFEQTPPATTSSRRSLEEAKQLNGLVEKLYGEGKFTEATLPAKQALAIREKVLGPSHPDFGESLNNLALVYQAQGAYAKAEPLLTRALAVRENALGVSHPAVVESLSNLAGVYRDQGAYAKAEPLLSRALASAEKVLGSSHPDIAPSLMSLAEIYRAQGAYAKAEPLLIRALAIRESAFGPNDSRVAYSLTSLAAIYRAQGAHAKAEPLFIRSLSIHEKVLGASHPTVASDLHNLGVVYRDQGAHAEAESLLTRALAIQENALGPSHPFVANTLHNLAVLYRDQGAYSNAEPLFIRALALDENALGPSHPDVAISLNDLALLYRAQGAHAKAEPLVARAADIREKQLRTELVRLSESRKRALITTLQDETESVVSLHADAVPGSPSALELALTTILRRKGRILDSMIDSDTRIRSNLTPPLREQLDQLARARSELVAQLYAPGGSAALPAVTATRARIDELESALSAVSVEVRAEVEPVTMARLQAALAAGTALVELVRYRRDDSRRPKKQRWQEARYVAYLLTAGGAKWVALGEAAPIDAAVDAVLVKMDNRILVDKTKAALRRLDALVLAPIRAQLAGISHIIVAPDGKLNLVPFESLVDPQGRYALENYLVSYVTTGRDLLRLAVSHTARSPAVIMADPDYGSTPAAAPTSFASLPEARAEATDLRGYFPGDPVTGGKATKSALAALAGPALLHLATHGFYARDPEARVPASSATMRGMFIKSGPRSSPRSEDPTDGLDRAGLAMAGANQGAGGIVTARELAGFDWSGAQLVVLSACETGVGAVTSGDGVYGMRRALVLAGSASQVLTLWRVSDISTRRLMRDYYRQLASGTGRAEALRQAKLGLLREPRYAHPYYWAAFIPAGDWRPLDKNTLLPRKPPP